METVFTEQRLATDGLSTGGELQLAGQRLCFLLEPGPNSASPRKPAGRYELVLRTEGGIYDHYRRHFGPEFFRGVPQIIVPGRTFVEVHIGNTFADTEACSLMGMSLIVPHFSNSGHYEVARSEEAFMKFYPQIRDALLAGPCFWETLAEAGAALS